MDFFARQEQTRRTTRRLIVLFALAFVSVALAAAIVVALIFQWLPALDTPTLSTTIGTSPQDYLQPVLATAGVVLLLMLIASAGRAAMLARGGASVARMLGGTEIHGESGDPLHRRLVNIVEEMSIAAGVPVPDVFVLEAESGINAFAAGLEQSDAAVAVTRGALERLNRAELQGVIAHEFSHILNGDMRINQRLMGFSFGILVLALAGRWMLNSMRFSRRSRGKGAGVAVALGAALLAIGYIGIFFGRLIKAAVSRQREMLADASAVQFTREPEGLASALKKIGGYTTEFTAAEAEEVAHMLFGRGSKSFRGWFATHPPLMERIQALEPGFREEDIVQQPEVPAQMAPNAVETAPVMRAVPAMHSASDARHSAADAFSVDDTGRIESAALGSALRSAIPEDLLAAAHSHEASWMLVLALVCTADADNHERPRAFLEQRLGVQRTQLCLRLASQCDALDVALRLPLLELCMPALRQRPDAQLQFLLESIREVAQQREHPELFDFVLPRVLTAWLGRHSQISQNRTRMRRRDAVNALIATVASFGHEDAVTARAAWLAASDSLQLRKPLPALEFTDNDVNLLRVVDSAVDTLQQSPNRLKRALLRAVLVAIRHDRQISVSEVELFRAVAAALDVPAPPLAVGAIDASDQ